jgi:hypothetical protein
MKWRNRPGSASSGSFFRSGRARRTTSRAAGSSARTTTSLPEPHVPLPPARDPLRRLAARRRPRLPGARRADVLGRRAAR